MLPDRVILFERAVYYFFVFLLGFIALPFALFNTAYGMLQNRKAQDNATPDSVVDTIL